LSSGVAVNNLTLAGGNLLNDSGQLVVNGGITNGGQIQVNFGSLTLVSPPPVLNNSGSIVVDAGSLTLGNNVTLSGGGNLVLNTGGNVSGSGTLTNADNIIEGFGSFNGGALAFTNQNIVDANVPGHPLTLAPFGGVTNTGTLDASNLGVLQLASGVINSGANITASGAGSTVQLQSGSSVFGGNLNNLTGGTLGTAAGNSTILDTVTINGLYTAQPGSTTYLVNTITNNGAGSGIQSQVGTNQNTLLLVSGNVTLNGGGTVTLSSDTAGDSTYIAQNSQSGGKSKLTNLDNIIQGSGVIGKGPPTAFGAAPLLSLDNQGTINANQSGLTLTLSGGGNVTNEGLLEATQGGILQIGQVTLTNSGAGKILANGGTVQFGTGANVTGGILASGPAGGTMQTLDGASVQLNSVTINSDYSGGVNSSTSMNSSTLNGSYTGGAGSTLFMSGTFENGNGPGLQGASQLNGATLFLTGGLTLTGGGTLTLNSTPGNAQIMGLGTLTNMDNTIQGSGSINISELSGAAGVVNSGTIDANVAGQTLLLGGAFGITNNGVLEATDCGILQISNPVTNFGLSAITAKSGGTVQLYTSITGGTLNNLNGGTIGTVPGGSASLNNVSIDGTYTGAPGSNTTLYNDIDGGTILLNGAGANASLTIGNNVSLAGTVTLNSAAPGTPGGGTANISQLSNGLTLDNYGSIEGSGNVGVNGLALKNTANATVNANIGSQVLALNGGGAITNQGVLEATNGGVLQISNPVTNTQAINYTSTGSINANGGMVQLMTGSSVTGGTLNNNGGWLGTRAGSSTTLDSVTINGTYTGDIASNTTIQNTITNHDTIFLNSGNLLVGNNNATLDGFGTVTLATAAGGGPSSISQTGGPVTLTNLNNIIQGNGAITGLIVINQISGTILANVPGQTLTISDGSLLNIGTMQVKPGSSMVVSSTLSNFSGSSLIGGTYVIEGAAGQTATMQLASLGNANGGEIVNNAASITLSGPTTNVRLVDAGGNPALTPLASNSGTLRLQQGFGFGTAGAFQNTGTLSISGGSAMVIGPAGFSPYTQSGQGKLSIDGASLSSGNSSLDGSGGVSATLLNSSWTVNGQLTIGVNGVAALDADKSAGSSAGLILGQKAGSLGTMTLGNASWTDTGGVVVGSGGSGVLNVSGGQLSTSGVTVGSGNASNSTMTLTGGATWTDLVGVVVGNFGTGSLELSDGATGTTSGSLVVGNSGTGTFLLDGQASFTDSGAYVGLFTGSAGTVVVDDSDWLNQGSVLIGSSGAGSVTLNNALATADQVTIGALGTLIEDPSIFDISGNFTLEPGGVLQLGVDGTNLSQLMVDGFGSLDGTLVIDFTDGYAPSAGDFFDLMSIQGGADLTDLNVEIEGLDPGFDYTYSYSDGEFTLDALDDGVSANSTPEPGPASLLAIGTLALLLLSYKAHRASAIASFVNCGIRNRVHSRTKEDIRK